MRGSDGPVAQVSNLRLPSARNAGIWIAHVPFLAFQEFMVVQLAE